MPFDHEEELDRLLEKIGFHGASGTRESTACRKVLDAVLWFGTEDRTISAGDLKALRKRNRWITTGANPRRLSRVLTGLNRAGWKCALPPHAVKPPRALSLPSTPSRAEREHEIHRLDRLVRRQWKEHTHAPAGRLFAAALLLVTRAGAGDQVACGILSRLRVRDIDGSGPAPCRIRTPIHGAADHDVYHEFVPPRPLKDLLLRQRKSRKRHGPDTLLFGDALGRVDPSGAGADGYVRRVLTAYLRRIRKSEAARQHRLSLPNTWGELATSGRWCGRHHGIPPAVLEVLGSYPLPKAALETELWSDPRQPAQGDIKPPLGSRLRITPSDQALEAPRLDNVSLNDEPRPDWGAAARLQARRFLSEIESKCTSRQGRQVLPSKGKAFRALLGSSLDEADRIAPSGRSVLHLVLHWLGVRLGEQKIGLTTARTYVGRIFQKKLFDFPESLDMETWDGETLDEITAQLLNHAKWSTKTQQDFIETWMQFLRFCTSNEVNILSPADLPRFKSDASAAARPGRRTIITPFQFDHVLRSIARRGGALNNAPHASQTVLILGFYGGMRSSEVLGLTAADVVITGNELRVNVRRSKTPAGRRAIPLHLILPSEEVYRPIARWVSERQNQVRGLGRSARLDDMPLFGPLVRRRRPGWKEVIEPALEFLRSCLQTDIDFHGLRHSAASWLVLRAYAVYHDDFKSTLRHGNHPSFDDDALEKLRNLFEQFTPAKADGKERMLVHIAKILGHSNLESLMQTYGHTFGPIQSHALSRASTWSHHLDRIAIR